MSSFINAFSNFQKPRDSDLSTYVLMQIFISHLSHLLRICPDLLRIRDISFCLFILGRM